jgi:preprotein translocase subunit SecF
MALLVLLFVGGEVTRGFAFTLTIGIITGTYSSIYIASAIVLDNDLRKKLKS